MISTTSILSAVTGGIVATLYESSRIVYPSLV